MTAATAAATLTRNVMGGLHSSYVVSSRIRLHRIEVINKHLVNDDFSFLIASYASLAIQGIALSFVRKFSSDLLNF